jgi:hypothetical protein
MIFATPNVPEKAAVARGKNYALKAGVKDCLEMGRSVSICYTRKLSFWIDSIVFGRNNTNYRETR